MKPIKVLIVDDHKLMRQGIMQLLELDSGIEIIGEASDGVECLSFLTRQKPNIILLDINMPNMNGFEVLSIIKAKRKKYKVLVLTIHNETEYLIKAMDLGVNGYILKDADFDDLREAIYTINKGENYIQPKLLPAFNARLVKKDLDFNKLNSLSKREKDVLILVAHGFFNKEIAIKLGISERTVKNHLSSVFKKIEVVDRTQAALFAIRNNLVQT